MPELVRIETGSFVQPWTRDQFLSEISKSLPTLYVIQTVRAGSLLGYICFWVIADEVQMLNLAVHPDYRRQGVGRSLLMFLLNRSREEKASTVFLEVRPSNQAALTLYRSLGFKTLYRRPRYYAAEGEDALVMERSLDEI